MADTTTTRAGLELILGQPQTHSGFNWDECADGLRLSFPPPDPRGTIVTPWFWKITLGAWLAAGAQFASGHPYGDELTSLALVVASFGTMLGLGSFVGEIQCRRGEGRSLAWLCVG